MEGIAEQQECDCVCDIASAAGMPSCRTLEGAPTSSDARSAGNDRQSARRVQSGAAAAPLSGLVSKADRHKKTGQTSGRFFVLRR
ncbi:hypothetical protein XB05_18820 [Xanthomonas arboricola]|nr:hypothetical protein XB05_18820 [Xanthomonas arboricola]